MKNVIALAILVLGVAGYGVYMSHNDRAREFETQNLASSKEEISDEEDEEEVSPAKQKHATAKASKKASHGEKEVKKKEGSASASAKKHRNNVEAQAEVEFAPEEIVVSAVEVEPVSAGNSSEVQKMIHDYIIEHPEVLVESLDGMQKKQAEAMKLQAEKAVATHIEEINNDLSSPVIGNKAGSNTVVMFYDVNCGYCKKAAEACKKLMSEDNSIRLVLKPFPILGKDSEEFAKIELAVNYKYPEKFPTIHEILMGNKRFSHEEAIQMLKQHGIDISEIEPLLKSDMIAAQLKKIAEIANAIHVNGVPAFVVNDKYYPGLLDYDLLREAIAATAPATQADAPAVEAQETNETAPAEEEAPAAKAPVKAKRK